MWKFVFSALLLVSVLENTFARELPSFLKKCKKSDPQLGACIEKNVEILKPLFKDGVPGLFIPSMNPLVIPEATLSGSDSFKAKFTDIQLINVDEFTLNHFKMSVDETKSMDVSIIFPRLRIKSVYNINGRILILNLDGTGPADGNYTNVHCTLRLKGISTEKNGKEYIRWEKEKIDIQIEKSTLFFDKIFGDNKQLNEQTNRVINDNIETIIDELRPVISQVVTDFIFNVVNRIFAKFAISELFIES